MTNSSIYKNRQIDENYIKTVFRSAAAIAENPSISAELKSACLNSMLQNVKKSLDKLNETQKAIVEDYMNKYASYYMQIL